METNGEGGTRPDPAKPKTATVQAPSGTEGGAPWWISSNWLQAATALLAGVAAFYGVWSTHQSQANGDTLTKLKFDTQTVSEFAQDIEQARPFIVDPKRQIDSMVEISRLWTVASTVQEKLVLFEIAKGSNQQQAISTLRVLAAGDVQLHPPKGSPDEIPVNELQQELLQATTDAVRAAAAQAPSATPSSSAATTAGHSRPVPAHTPTPQPSPPPVDANLTTSSNKSVATNARLLVALGQSAGTQGWVFTGDALDSKGGADATSATFVDGTETSSIEKPAASGDFIACTDVNLRVRPWDQDTKVLGPLVTIVPRGTTLTATGVTSFPGEGALSHQKIHAWWSNVTVKGPADRNVVDTACANVPANSQ